MNRAIEGWAYSQGIAFTRATVISVYGAVFVAPFLFCVIGLDSKRWETDYWFGDNGKADMRRIWVRWVAYAIGSLVALGSDTPRGVRAVKTSRRMSACPRPRTCKSIGGRSVGRPRCRRMRSTAVRCSMSARKRSRPPQAARDAR